MRRGGCSYYDDASSKVRESRKFIPASDGPRKNVPTNSELGNDPAPQLYDLDADPGETRNMAGERPDILDRLRKDLTEP
jgi:hypothetical protein